MNEFEIIRHYFAAQIQHRPDVITGIGDDAAIVSVPPGNELAVTTDTLVENVHFLAADPPYDIAYKALAVNLSDLAAMGASPAWVMLALTMPGANTDWIQDFCTGLFTLANRHRVQLIGGDMTHGPLSITIQAMGFVPAGKAVLRSQAKPGDLIYVTGTLGDAGLALARLQQKIQLDTSYQRMVMERLHRPEPRLATGGQLTGLASAAIDISDGLAADLGHILEQSGVGALINVDTIPLSEALQHSLPHEKAVAMALTAGDDYELCFTVPPHKRGELESRLAAVPCRYTRIGIVTEQAGLILRYQNGDEYHGSIEGYQHF